MTKIVFVGNSSKIPVSMAKTNTTLEDAVLRCYTCKRDTTHKYTGFEEEGGDLTFIYTCRNCGEKYTSNRKF